MGPNFNPEKDLVTTYTFKPQDSDENKSNLKILSWNVAGIRAITKKNGFNYIQQEDPDIIALQEVKCEKYKLPKESKITGYEHFFSNRGNPGVAVFSKVKPIDIINGLQSEDFNDRDRVITAEYEHFYLVNVYVPYAGENSMSLPKRLKFDHIFRNFIKSLDKNKPVIICGDMNVAHHEIDLFDPKSNSLTAGFTQEERNNFTKLLNNGFIDVYIHLNPDKKDAYTFWTYLYNTRIKNEGWRLDYIIVSERMKDKIQECAIRNDIQGSDHCPIVAQFKLPHNNRKREVFPCISTHELNGSELESSDYNSSGEENNEPARLLPIQTRQSKKTEETKSKTLPKSSGRPKIRPSIIPPKSKDSSSKPSVSGTQQVTTTKTRLNLRPPTTLRRTTPTLDESTIGKNLLRRRMEERRNQNRPNYQESSTESDDESRNESDASLPPILRKNKSVLPSLDLPLAAFPSPKVPKSAAARAPGHFQELFQEQSDQEQPTPVEEQKGPIIYVSPPHSDSDDSSSDEERNENENSKLTRAELPKSISQFNESLKAHKEWIEEDKEDENAVPTREVTAISEGEDDEELLNAIEELEPDSDTELTQRINSVIHWAQEEVEKIKARNDKEEKDTESSSQVKEDKKRKSVTFATQQKLSDTPDTMGIFRPSEIGVPQALSTPFQHTDKIMEEAYPKSPIKSSENHMPRRVKIDQLEPNYTTATVEPASRNL